MAHPEQVDIDPMVGPYGRQRQVQVSVKYVRNHKTTSPIKQEVTPVELNDMVGPFKKQKEGI